jgi:hypothetical protein
VRRELVDVTGSRRIQETRCHVCIGKGPMCRTYIRQASLYVSLCVWCEQKKRDPGGRWKRGE